MEQIKFYCESQELGMSEISTGDFCILLIGNREMDVNTVALAGSHILIGGILAGAWAEGNEEAREAEENKPEETKN